MIEVPTSWQFYELDQLASVTDGTHVTPTYLENGVPFLRVTDIQGQDINLNAVKRISMDEHLELTKRCKPEKGDILYSKNGTIGITKVVTWDWEFSTFVSLALLKIKDHAQLDIQYFAHYLASDLAKQEIYKGSKQGTVTNLHLEEIRKFRVPLPPLPEQRKIAAILSTWDEAITLTERLIDAMRQRKQALMQLLLTGEVRFKEFAGTEWQKVTLGAVTQINPTKPREINEQTIVSFITMADVSEDAKVVSCSQRPYSEVDNGFTSFQDNDVLVAKITPCFENGKGALVADLQNGLGFGSTEFHVIRTDPTCVLPQFVYYHTITHQFRGYGEASMTGSAGQKRVPKEFISAYSVLLPSLLEQAKIVDLLADCDLQIVTLRNLCEHYNQEKRSLMQHLLTGAIRVQTEA